MNIEVQAPARPALSPFYEPEHEAFRDTMRRFVAKEIEPFATEWDEAGEFPRELYGKAAAIGLLQLGFPEEYGGIACDCFMRLVASQELARCGAGGTKLPSNRLSSRNSAIRWQSRLSLLRPCSALTCSGFTNSSRSKP